MSFLNLLAAEAPNGYHFAGDIREVWWGSLAFFVLIGLLWWKLGPVIVQAMQARTERIEAELQAAESERQAAETALTASTSDLPDVAEEEARIRAEAIDTAAKLKADLITRAEAEADAIRERGKADVASRRRQAQADLSAEVSEAARRATEDIVRTGLDDSAQRDLIESYINQVSGMS